ncbi:unnamed protein product [Meloidogyne enterolobii]|uniref:Uncharacterized protein n=1 Tax=Meloidogyne enterolobii TaxID=390850 RepID=A0ACB1A1L3_MELEN
MAGIAAGRLLYERRDWLRNPLPDFIARPILDVNGLNLFNWECAIPGPKGTIWEGGLFKLRMIFKDNFPLIPPKCRFEPTIFHPNVFPNAIACLRLLYEDWRPTVTIKQVLLAIQDLLVNPNLEEPVQAEAYLICTKNRQEYERRVREQAQRFSWEVVEMEMFG